MLQPHVTCICHFRHIPPTDWKACDRESLSSGVTCLAWSVEQYGPHNIVQCSIVRGKHPHICSDAGRSTIAGSITSVRSTRKIACFTTKQYGVGKTTWKASKHEGLVESARYWSSTFVCGYCTHVWPFLTCWRMWCRNGFHAPVGKGSGRGWRQLHRVKHFLSSCHCHHGFFVCPLFLSVYFQSCLSSHSIAPVSSPLWGWPLQCSFFTLLPDYSHSIPNWFLELSMSVWTG